MCLYVKTGCYPKNAEKDIICYKKVNGNYRYWMPFVRYSNHKFKWNVVEIARIENYFVNKEIDHLLVEHDSFGSECIFEGFHACLNKNMILGKDRICIVPIGTEYCLGFNDEIVAVKMIVFRSMLDYYWYRIKKLWHG